MTLKKIKIRRILPDTGMAAHKMRYKYKPEFAKQVRERSLKEYRKSKGAAFELSGSTVLRSLTMLDDNAARLPVENKLTHKLVAYPVLRLPLVAKLLDVSYQTLWRWSSETNQLPVPVLYDSRQGKERPTYHVEEVRIMIVELGEHLNHFKYYRKDHNGTRDRIFQAIEELRNSNYGELPHDQKSARQIPGKIRTRIRKVGNGRG